MACLNDDNSHDEKLQLAVLCTDLLSANKLCYRNQLNVCTGFILYSLSLESQAAEDMYWERLCDSSRPVFLMSGGCWEVEQNHIQSV